MGKLFGDEAIVVIYDNIVGACVCVRIEQQSAAITLWQQLHMACCGCAAGVVGGGDRPTSTNDDATNDD